MTDSETRDAPECGLFDFMANNLGVRVLHPGGYDATKALVRMCGVSAGSRVLDLACGAGTTSFFLAKRFQCRVDAIDISERLIEAAKQRRPRESHGDEITFQVADARQLPFADSTFDAVLAQAFFILIDEGERALAEIARVLKPNGRLGALELGWFERPSPTAFRELQEKTCDQFIPRVRLFGDWVAFFESAGLECVSVTERHMPSGMMQMVKAEGIANTLRIMRKMMGNETTRRRMMEVQQAFGKYDETLGYGLFCLTQ
jgi:ubiquinone/menaquinone biosynthesis C-methylase UbiE